LVKNSGKYNVLTEALVAQGLWGKKSGAKFIPHQYLVASRHERLALFAGLMDSDGCSSKSGCDYITKSKELATDLMFLVRSLGFAAHCTQKYCSCQTGSGGWFFRLSIWGDFTDVPCRLARRKPSPRKQKKSVLRTGFKIEPFGRGQYFGFQLDGDHLYVDGHFVVHHNSGKTPVMATICRDAVEKWNGRVLILAHVKELLQQTADTLRCVAPDLEIGVYSAGLKSRDTRDPIIVAGIQSVYKRACELDAFDLAIVDESHMIPPDGEGMYRQFLADARVVNPHIRVIGLTATPYRLKGGLICKPDHFLNHVCYEIGVKELILQGYLCPLKSKAGKSKANLSSLHIRSGEFIASEVEKAMDNHSLVQSACEEIVELTGDRNSVLIFASSVSHGRHIARAIARFSGQECGFVCGETPGLERESLLQRFKAGELKYLANVNVLTTGFDAPIIDCVVMLRPTNSPGLYYQMVGRGFRLHPGKADCLAEGQRVFTDRGLVPIEQVTTTMRVWDGVEFVRHQGAICRGEQEVVCYAGITATPDHKVWTQEGWKTLWQCAIEQTPVSVTGVGGQVVRKADGYFRRGGSPRPSPQAIPACEMQDLRGAVSEMLHQPDASGSGLSQVRAATARPEVARAASIGSQGPLYESSQSAISRLRRTGDRVPVRDTNCDGGVDSGEPWPSPRQADRPNRQQRSLPAGKPAVCDGKREHAQHPAKRRMRVWDILNAGPRHRFTCEGLLVSNCQILDYGGNIIRHGPVDDLKIKEPGQSGGEAPAKECPECQALMHAAYSTCPECGYEFPPPEREKHDAKASGAGILSGQTTDTEYDIEDVAYYVHVKRGASHGHPKTMRVDYQTGWNEWKSEWVCPEHTGYAREKFKAWWQARSNEPVPDAATEAVLLASAGALALTTQITVRSVTGEKYDRVISHKLEAIPPRLAGDHDDSNLPDYEWAGDEIPF
jgi:hypothetical protein